MERNREVGRRLHENAHRIVAANTGSESRRLFLLWRSSVRRPLLRHAKPGQSAEAAMPVGLPYERATASPGIWSTSAAASGESAWLQDGQMDRAYRVHRVGKDAWQRRRRQERRR